MDSLSIKTRRLVNANESTLLTRARAGPLSSAATARATVGLLVMLRQAVREARLLTQARGTSTTNASDALGVFKLNGVRVPLDTRILATQGKKMKDRKSFSRARIIACKAAKAAKEAKAAAAPEPVAEPEKKTKGGKKKKAPAPAPAAEEETAEAAAPEASEE